MPDADDILDDAMQPLKVEGDMGKVEENPVSEKIAALRFAKAQSANGLFGMRIKQIVPPDANGS